MSSNWFQQRNEQAARYAQQQFQRSARIAEEDRAARRARQRADAAGGYEPEPAAWEALIAVALLLGVVAFLFLVVL